jgi:hypothetical protein
MESLTDLQRGDQIRVIRGFTDFDGVAWVEGQALEYIDYSYFPYDGGYTFRFAEATLRLAYLDDGNDHIIRNPDEYFVRVAQ